MTRTLGNCWRCGEPIHENGLHACEAAQWRLRYNMAPPTRPEHSWIGLRVALPVCVLVWTLVVLGIASIAR